MDSANSTDEDLLRLIAEERATLLRFEKTFYEHERHRRGPELQTHHARLEATRKLIEIARSRGLQFPATSILSFSVGERVLDSDGLEYRVEGVSVVAMLITRETGTPEHTIHHMRTLSDEQVPRLKRLGGPA